MLNNTLIYLILQKNDVQNALKEAILQAMTKNSNVNAATLQALQCMTVEAPMDRPAAIQNGQNNKITAIHDILPICGMVEVV